MKLKLSLLLVLIITYSWSQSGSTKTFTGNGVFLVPAGVSSVNVQAWGGGGSGGGASGAPLLLGRGAAGGGGGAYASNIIFVTPGTTLNIVVASQTAGTSGAGITGGNSTITGFESSILAAGGSGGDANNAGGSPIGGSGGTIAASAGSTKFAGANGGSGNSWNLLGLLLSSGAGGAGGGSGGAGGTPVSGLIFSNAPGNAGSPPGGAGSGAINSALGASQIGGAGAAGRIIISYSCADFSLTSTTATSVCGSTGTTSTVTLTGSAASLPVGNYEVTYNRSNPSATALTANLTVSSAGTGTFTAVGLTTGGSSTITITKLTSESCSSAITANNTATVTVSPATVGGAASGGITVCSGSTSGFLTLSGNTGSVVKWQSSVSPFSTWSDIANTTTTYTSGALTETTQFRAVVQSGACTAVNSAATTVTVSPATVGGTVSGGTTINSGDTSGLLTLSGHTGSVIKWQSSVNPFSTWTDIANTTTTYTSGALIETTQFRAVLSGTCGTANSIATTVTVNLRPTIALASSTPDICSDIDGIGQSTTLSYSATTGNPITYSIVWNASPSNSFAAVTDAVLPASPITILVPGGTVGGTYTGTLTVKNANGTVSLGSVFTLKVKQTASIISNDIIDSINTSTSVQYTTLAYSGIIGNPTGYSLIWDQPAMQSQIFDSFTFSPGGGVINNIKVSANVPAGTYTGTMNFYSDDCYGAHHVSIVISNPAPTIALASTAEAHCINNYGAFTSTTLAYTATTGNPTTYSIVWDSSPANDFGAITDAVLQSSPISITIPSGATPGTYTGTLTVKNANGIVSSPGSTFSVTLNEIPKVATTGIIDAVCSSTNSQNAVLTFTDFEGNPTHYSINWYEDANAASLADQGDTPFEVDPNGSIVTIAIPANVPAGTYYGLMNIFNENCVESQHVSITINSAPSINLSASAETVCQGTEEQNTPIFYNGRTNSPVTYSIVWDSSPANTFVAVTDEELFDLRIGILVPANTAPGTYTGTITVKNENGCASPGYPFNVTVNTQPTITTTGTIASVSVSSSIQNTTLAYTASTNISSGQYFIDWDEDLFTDQGFTSSTFASGGGVINNIEIPANIPAGTYSGLLVILSESCSIDQPVSITINALPTIALAFSAENICLDNSGNIQYTSLGYKGTTGNPVTYSIVWDASPENNLVAVTDVALPSSPISIDVPDDTSAGTYTGTLTVKGVNGVSSLGKTFILNVGLAPTIDTNGIIASVCTSDVAQNSTLAYAGVVGNPTSYYIDWSQEANDASLADQPVTPFTFGSWQGTIDTIEISPQVLSGTYSGTIYIVDGSCVASHEISVTIDPAPSITFVNSESFTVCSGDNSVTGYVLFIGEITGSPTTYSLVWNSSPENNLQSVIDEALPQDLIAYSIPPELAVGTYTATLTVKNENGCLSEDHTITLIIEESPTITTSGTLEAITTSTGTQNAVLAYTAATGNPILYKIDWNEAANDALLADQSQTSFSFSSSGGSLNTIAIPANVVAGTYSGTLSIENESCVQRYPISITINPVKLPSITIDPVSTICLETGSSSTPDTFAVLIYYETTGSPVTYSIAWDSSPANNLVAVTDEELSNYIFIPVASGTNLGIYTGTITVKDANGISSLGSTFSLEISDSPTISTSGTINSVATSTNSQNATLAYSSSTGNPSRYSINWNSAANTVLLLDQSSTPFVFNPGGGTIDNILIPANVPAGTYSGVMNILNSASCDESQNISLTINPVAVPTIALASSAENVCMNEDFESEQTTLGYKGTTGNPITYSIVWDSSPTNSFAAVNDAVLQASPITIEIPAGTISATYTGTLIVKDENGVSSWDKTFTVNVGATPTISIPPFDHVVCASTNSQITKIYYRSTTGNPVSYYINWNQAANDASLEDQGDTPYVFNEGEGFIDTVVVSPNVPAGTYSGELYVVNGFCSWSHPVSIVINPSSKAPIIGTITNANNSHPGSVALSGLPSGNWVIVNNLDEVKSGSGTSTIFTVSGGMTYTFKVTPEGGCPSPESESAFVGFEFGRPISKETPSAATTDLESIENSVSISIDNQVIHVEAPDQIINEVYVFDVSGNLLYKKDAISDSRLVINNLRSSNQVLVVRVILNNNRVATKKVIY